MSDYFTFAAEKLANLQQNTIGLTGEDYDATPMFVTMGMNITLKKTIKVEYKDLQDGYYYWGYPGKVWGDGTIWNSEETTWGDWITQEEIVSTNYNTNSFNLILSKIEHFYDYLAYGTGEVADNATSLVDEKGRVLAELVAIQTPVLHNEYQIDENTANGETIKEYGLAGEATGDISSTEVYAPIEKNVTIYVGIIVDILLKNFEG